MRISHKMLVTLVLLSGLVGVGCYQSPNQTSFASQTTKQSQASQSHQAPITASVKSKKANLRNRPLRSAAIVATVERGDPLILVESNHVNGWYQVRSTKLDKVGWVNGHLIALAETATLSPSAATVTGTRATKKATPNSSGRSYINVDGERVPSPVFSDTAPAGASARCRDGSYSFSRTRRGTCSHHGGVARWL